MVWWQQAKNEAQRIATQHEAEMIRCRIENVEYVGACSTRAEQRLVNEQKIKELQCLPESARGKALERRESIAGMMTVSCHHPCAPKGGA